MSYEMRMEQVRRERPGELKQRLAELRAAHPRTRLRDAADELGVSEAELVATGIGETTTQLSGEWADLVRILPTLGRCMALTRNPQVVSEVRGVYGGVRIQGVTGQVAGKAIDLRLFLRAWRHGFAVEEPGPGGPRRSLQFFDASGAAVHAVFLEPEGCAEAFDNVRVAFAAAEQDALLSVEPAPAPPMERPDVEVNGEALRARWDAMRDTHELFPLLRELRVTRPQALRLAGIARARVVGNHALGQVLDEAARAGDRLMLFVGSPGVLQVRSGQLVRVERAGPWLRVLDPEFSLHVREDRIAASWVVKKPTTSGLVTSLELFDADGEPILLVLAARDDRANEPDPGWWRERLARLGPTALPEAPGAAESSPRRDRAGAS